MKLAIYGRIVFGAAAVLFGVIGLMWHDADTWQSMYSILRLPLGAAIGTCLMVAQIAGGIGLPFARTMRPASIALIVVYALFCLACIPGIVAHPKSFGEYDGFFEQFSLLCGALAVYTLTEPSGARAATLARATRIGLGICAISFTLAQWVYLQLTANLVPKWIPPNQMFWAVATTVAFGLAAVAILINRQSRPAIRLMSAMMALFGVLVWIPILMVDPHGHGNWSEFAFTFLIAGASWTVADARYVGGASGATSG